MDENDYYGHYEGDQVSTWRATQAKAQFSAVLDRAKGEGPQLVTRRQEEYLLVTKAQWETHGRTRAEAATNAPKQSLWDKLRCAPEKDDPEVEFSRVRSESRIVEF